ncbi:hypothetical protein SAMN05421799_1245 [Alicyclobacillus vulcanalis]|uniref:Uncharacterized protein n=1 Tax=Alicyclobacillus vulcanalis TaxID=252246 RepID=A0A1N7PX99_9BACL|nr:hypothetical protein SAMN05421799_1245 [Alicyclobacillus vulcanalis]
MVSLSPVHVTISDEAYRLCSQYSESESTGEERSAWQDWLLSLLMSHCMPKVSKACPLLA